MPEPPVERHPETAAARGIREGEWYEVKTQMGAMRARARFSRHLAPQVVCAQYRWWQYQDGAGDANRPIDGECFDPVAHSNSLRNFHCQVFPLPVL